MAILIDSGAMGFQFWQKWAMYVHFVKSNLHAFENIKMAVFETLELAQFDFS